MINKKTVIDSIEILPTGRVQARFAMFLEEDGNVIGEPKYHRMGVDPGQDFDEIFRLNDEDITTRETLKWSPIEKNHMYDMLKAVVGMITVA